MIHCKWRPLCWNAWQIIWISLYMYWVSFKTTAGCCRDWCYCRTAQLLVYILAGALSGLDNALHFTSIFFLGFADSYSVRDARLHLRHIRDLLRSLDPTDAYNGVNCSSLSYLTFYTRGDKGHFFNLSTSSHLILFENFSLKSLFYFCAFRKRERRKPSKFRNRVCWLQAAWIYSPWI